MPSPRLIAPVKDNAEKYDAYRQQISQYNRAIHEGFYLQAILIDYALLEDRFRSFLYHMGAFKNRKSIKIDTKLAKEDLAQMVKMYKKEANKETDNMGVMSISGKMKIIRCAVEWAIHAENIQPDEQYCYVLKNGLEGIDQQEMLCIIEEVSEWCKYRNEIIHCLLNKNSFAVNEVVQIKAEEGFMLARRLDDQVRALKSGSVIRKKLRLPVESSKKAKGK